MEPYPLRFEPIYKEKVWGGRKLANLGRELPGDDATLIGESWELTDLGETSVSGGGGGAERSVIANGPLAGKTLHEALALLGAKLTGDLPLGDAGDFPLLVKFLDSEQHLSVQVHPSEAYAAGHPDAHLKSEAWYIVEAAPGAVIYKGVREGVTPEAFRAAIESDLKDVLIEVPARKGDCHYLPSGTCHALGAGLLVAEVQTPSDTTFRVYDWGRTDRELHVEHAMQCIEFGPPPPEVLACERRSHVAGIFTTVSCLVTCEHFRIERVRMSGGYEQEIPYNQPVVWMILEGGGHITGPDIPETPFSRGQTWLIPAALNEARVHLDDDTAWLDVTFPQANTRLA